MSQHVSACDENDGLWLPLTEYAVRSGVSLSTIRRKIKSNTIHYRLEKGRYLIRFDEGGGFRPEPAVAPVPVTPPPVSKPVKATDTSARLFAAPPQVTPPVSKSDGLGSSDERWAFPVERAVRMVSEAFERTLKEKDERIRLLEQRNDELEQRLNELRTLVRVLEEKYEVRY